MFPATPGPVGCNELENPIGIETETFAGEGYMEAWRCNELENPIGIETRGNTRRVMMVMMSCNELENPIGIETQSLPDGICGRKYVATNLKTR